MSSNDVWASTPAWPAIRVDTTNMSTMVDIAGRTILFSDAEHRRDALDYLLAYAQRLGRPLRIVARDQTNRWLVVATPDGQLVDAGQPAPERRRRRT